MKRSLVYLAAAFIFTLALVFPLPNHAGTAKASSAADACDECQGRCQQHIDQCVAVHGTTELRCFDQFNSCIVRCFRNFCEQ